MARALERIPSPQEIGLARIGLLSVAKALREIDPEIGADEKLFHDMLDGEGGDFLDILRAAMRASFEAQGYADTLAFRIQTLCDRARALEERADRLRSAVLAALQALNMPAIRDAEFTATVRAGSVSVDVSEVDPNELPDALARIVPARREPDKALIKAALMSAPEGSNPVPGAKLIRGLETLAVRKS